ncbi:hypothetical protein LCGC14_2851300, partial [marine sediment metagenome]
MAGEDFYKGGKVANVNYVGYDIVATFRNTDGELVSGNVISIDYCLGTVKLTPPKSTTTHYKQGEITTQATLHKGFGVGSISTPLHPATSGMPWMHTFTGVCSTSGDIHTFTPGNSAYFYAYQFEMENTSYPIRQVALGCYRTHYRFEFGQEDACMHSYEDGVAKVIATSANITRPITHDFRPVFPAGQHTHTFTYNADSLGIVVLGGYLDRTINYKVFKTADQHITDIIKTSVNDEWGFTCRVFRDSV